MSGHNKWSKIKRKKGAEDSKRSKLFSKILKEITVACKEGLSDPDVNPRLRVALANAKGANMPKDTVQRAINKASDSNTNYQEVTYEGYGPGGIAIFVECTTDNIKRTVSSVRHHFSRDNGNLGTNGSLDFLFDRKGVFVIPLGEQDEETFTMEMIDAGADDVDLDEGIFNVTCPYESFGSLQKKLEELKIEPESADLQRIPKSTNEVDTNTAKQVMRLIDMLEEDDDVQAVFHNLELTDELAAQLNE